MALVESIQVGRHERISMKRHKSLAGCLLIMYLLNNEQNDEVSDTTGDASSTVAGYIIILLLNPHFGKLTLRQAQGEKTPHANTWGTTKNSATLWAYFGTSFDSASNRVDVSKDLSVGLFTV